MNRQTFLDIETAEQVTQYIDNLCSDPKFLCKHRDLCGNNTTIYSSISDVDGICKNSFIYFKGTI